MAQSMRSFWEINVRAVKVAGVRLHALNGLILSFPRYWMPSDHVRQLPAQTMATVGVRMDFGNMESAIPLR